MSLLPDSPPAMFYWRRLPHRVRHADGPERIAAEWWCDDSVTEAEAVRDYYRLEVEGGRRFWVFRRGLYRPEAAAIPVWYLHGLFA
jgi:protein ImuB